MVSQIHTKETSLESLHIVHIFPTFGPKFGPLELLQTLNIQYTNTRDPYLQVCGVLKLYLNSKGPNVLNLTLDQCGCIFCDEYIFEIRIIVQKRFFCMEICCIRKDYMISLVSNYLYLGENGKVCVCVYIVGNLATS